MQIGEGLDYLRDGLFTVPDMQQIGADPTGLSLTNLLDAVVQRAIRQRRGEIGADVSICN